MEYNRLLTFREILLTTAKGTIKPPAPKHPWRLLSVDVFRGIAVAGMLLVDYAGDEPSGYPLIRHARWNGLTGADLVFPSFVFLTGISIVLSFSARLERGETRQQIAWHAAKRSLALFALGVSLNGIPQFHLATWRIEGVVQRIAVCYLVAGILFLFSDVRGLVVATLICLLGYWALMRMIPVPGFGLPGRDIPILEPDHNLVDWIDRAVFPGRLYNGTRDPEGILSTIPAVASALVGVLAGLWLRSERSLRTKAAGMFAIGVASLAVGAIWNRWFPINKNVWTSSFVVVTAGFALVFLSLLFWIIEIRGWRGRWTMPFLVFGMNAIVAFVLDETLWVPMSYVHNRAADGTPITWQQYLNDQLLNIASPANASLLYAIATVVFCWVLMWLLYRRRIFVKI
jgi:predicted acyltransferase